MTNMAQANLFKGLFKDIKKHPQDKLRSHFTASFCIDHGKHFLDHFPILHPCRKLREAISVAKSLPPEKYRKALEAATESATRAFEHGAMGTAACSKAVIQEFHRRAVRFAVEHKEDYFKAIETAVFLATGRPGDKIRQTVFSMSEKEDEESLLNADMLEAFGGSRREVDLNRYSLVFGNLATDDNFPTIASAMHTFLLYVLVAAYEPAEESGPHPSHQKGRCGIATDDTHWSVILAHCAACGEHNERLLSCGRCFTVAYCSTDCQKRHWLKHKSACVKAT